MIKHLWSVIAASASIDQQTNYLSLFNIMDEITANPGAGATLPALVPLNHAVVTVWQKEKGKEAHFEMKIEIVGPNKATLGQFSQTINMPAQLRRMRTITNMQTFPLVGAGEYHFRILAKLEGQDIQEYDVVPLDIIIPKTES